LQVGRFAGFEAAADSTPWSFVSVASKGVSFSVSLLFTTLARRLVSVAGKGLMGVRCWRKGNGLGREDLGKF
jgi:hypothetical protein